MKRIAVFSGGGADGAFTVGRLSMLQKSYDGCIGVSTGALMAIHAMNKDYEKLRSAYMVGMSDIFNKNPFNDKEQIRKLFTLTRGVKTFISKTNTIGESKNLRSHIDNNLEIYDYEKTRTKNIKLGVVSRTYGDVVYINNKESFSDFKDWMWISSNIPVLMSSVKKKRPNTNKLEQWSDGGLREGTPIYEACNMAGEGGEVDVFLHEPEKNERKETAINNVFDDILSALKLIYKDVNINDLERGIDKAEKMGIKLNLYYMPKEYYDNPFIFSDDKMNHLYNMGIANYNKCVVTKDFRKNGE
jgi:predicted acylesterase/phospholipase RssA